MAGDAAVIDGKPMRTSVSALQTLDACARKWWYRYVARLPDTHLSKGAQRGKEGHARIEHYLKTGEMVLDRLELLAVEKEYMPVPQDPRALVEYDFAKDGFTLDGHVRMSGQVDHVLNAEGLITLTDWKFKKSLATWGSTADDLIDPNKDAGIQLLGYGAWALEHFDRRVIKTLTLRHVTFQTQGRREVEQTAVTLTRNELPDLEARWGAVKSRLVPRLYSTAAQPTVDTVPQSLDVCERYGGCAYKNTCLDRAQKLKNLLTPAQYPLPKETDMAFSDFVAPSPAPVIVPPPPVPPPAAPPPTPAPSVPPASAVLVQDAVQNASYLVNGVPCRYVCPITRASGTVYSFAPKAGGAPILLPAGKPIFLLKTDFVPEENLPVVLPPDAPPIATGATLPAPLQEPAVPTPVVAYTPQTQEQTVALLEASIAAAPPAPADAPKRGRGRPPKATPIHKPAPLPPEVLAGAIQTPLIPAVPQGGIYLYFVGTPVGERTRSLIDYVDELDASLVKEAGEVCDDLRAARSEKLSFGKWKGLLAKLALESPPEPGHYVVRTGTDERVDVVAGALVRIATLAVLP